MSFAYPQVCDHHSRPWSPAQAMSTHSNTIAAAKGMFGCPWKKYAAPPTTNPATISPGIGQANHRQRTTAIGAAAAVVSSHLLAYRKCHTPAPSGEPPQLAKTSTATIGPKSAASWCSGRASTASGATSAGPGSSPCLVRSKSRAMTSPMTTLKTTAPIARARPISTPSTRAVRITASTLIAGPA